MKELNNEFVKAEDVIGVKVMNPEGKHLGEIEELVLDKHTGQTHYAVLSFGGIMGLGDKLFALPWKALSYDTDQEKFLIPHSHEQLKNAPGFDKNDWPDLKNEEWKNEIDVFYG